MKIWILGSLAVLGLSLPLTAEGALSSDRGSEIYTTYCATCHGNQGQGDGPQAARLKRDFGVLPTDLTSREFQEGRSNEDLERAIRGGGAAVHRQPYMPAWGLNLSNQQVDDLIHFLRELRKP